MRPPVRLAVLGLGRMGRFHLDALAGVEEIEVVALAEPSAPALDAAATSCPEATPYASPDEAIAHPDLEACLVASPTPTHPRLVAAAIEQGLHTLCEKPLALEPSQADALGGAAADRGLVLQVGFWRRFAPPWVAAKALFDGGAIGRAVLLRLAQWDADAPPPAFCDPAVSGGLAIDCGVHEYDLAEWLTGRTIRRVSAWALPVVDDGVAAAGDVDNLVAVLELDGGAVRDRRPLAQRPVRRRRPHRGPRCPGRAARRDAADGADPGGFDRRPARGGRLDGGGRDGRRRRRAGTRLRCRGSGRSVDVPGAAASARATAIGHAVMAAARTGSAVEVRQ